MSKLLGWMVHFAMRHVNSGLLVTFVSQSGYLTSLIFPVSSRFCTSTSTILFRSGVNPRRFCRTGGWSGSTLSWCVMTDSSIPTMSLCDRVKQSMFWRRTPSNRSLMSLGSCDPIRTVLSGSKASIATSSSSPVCSSGVRGATDAICDCYASLAATVGFMARV